MEWTLGDRRRGDDRVCKKAQARQCRQRVLARKVCGWLVDDGPANQLRTDARLAGIHQEEAVTTKRKFQPNSQIRSVGSLIFWLRSNTDDPDLGWCYLDAQPGRRPLHPKVVANMSLFCLLA